MSKREPVALATHLTASVRTMRRRYRKRLARCQKKFSETSVHHLRIETRRMLALAYSAALNAPVEETRFGVFRM